MKIGVYFCNCGVNVSEKIDANQVEQEARRDGDVSYFKTYGFLCSEDGKKYLEDDLRSEKPDRVVIAACSPREHERTFMDVLSSAEMNPYLMHMVNIREFVGWVTADKAQATAKAGAYIRAALARVKLQEPLSKTEIDANPDVLVIGAGPAGLKTALALAASGRRVILAEKTPAIGGMPVRYEDVFPDMECGPCMLEPILSDVLHGEHAKNIQVLPLSEVVDVAGYFGNFIVTVKTSPRYVSTTRCIGCMACLEVCPASTADEFNYGLNERKAIAFPFLGALPNAPSIDPKTCVRFAGEDCSLCKTACQEICGEEDAIEYDDQERVAEYNVGTIVTAVGASLLDCSEIPNLGYGNVPDVYTSLEFERITASNGPTGGEIKTGDGEPVDSVAIIHCVGSLDADHKQYCSAVCCQYAFKYNHLLSTRFPEARIYHFYKELVVPGKDEYRLYAHAKQDSNTSLIRY